jgi:hypothetical protein
MPLLRCRHPSKERRQRPDIVWKVRHGARHHGKSKDRNECAGECNHNLLHGYLIVLTGGRSGMSRPLATWPLGESCCSTLSAPALSKRVRPAQPAGHEQRRVVEHPQLSDWGWGTRNAPPGSLSRCKVMPSCHDKPAAGCVGAIELQRNRQQEQRGCCNYPASVCPRHAGLEQKNHSHTPHVRHVQGHVDRCRSAHVLAATPQVHDHRNHQGESTPKCCQQLGHKALRDSTQLQDPPGPVTLRRAWLRDLRKPTRTASLRGKRLRGKSATRFMPPCPPMPLGICTPAPLRAPRRRVVRFGLARGQWTVLDLNQ